MRLAPAVAVVLLASCGGDDGPQDPPGTSTPVLRTFGYLQAIDLDRRTVSFDAAEFLEGDAADRAARDDGSIGPNEQVPNDYYVRNPDRIYETLPLADQVVVTRLHCNGGCREGLPGGLTGLASSFAAQGVPTLADDYRGPHSQYWLTLERHEVTRIDEQYLP